MNHENTETPRQTAKLLDSARRRLVETGTRNRLIHVNRNAKRSNTLNIINERSDDVFAILRVNGRRMKFAATASEEDDEIQDGPLMLPNYTEEELDESRFRDQFLETPLTQDRLQKRLLRLALDARTAEEEQGVNILYLALGFLRWFEDKNSAMQREAPLILLPVDLVRNQRTSTYDLRCRDDDVVTNLPLQERLRSDFGVDLPEMNDSTEWTPYEYFQLVQDAIAGHPRWTVDEDGIQLGFFSFSKLLMLRDLDPENWPNEALMHSDLIQKLLEDSFELEPDLMFENKARSLDEILSPADILHVVDTDASQAKVIEEVRSGRNLIVQGPPGTGKSQTITNILAAAAHDGKTVLFVAEKMAALQVVYKRMVNVGLADLCLELHSRRANKKSFLQELARTLSSGRAVPDQPDAPNELKAARDELNRIAGLLHASVPGSDFTPFEVMSSIIGFMGRGVTPPQLEEPSLADLSSKDVQRIGEEVGEFAQAMAVVGRIADHPFFGVGNHKLQPPDIQRMDQEIKTALGALEELLAISQKVSLATGSKSVSTLADTCSQVQLLRHTTKAPDNLLANSPPLLAEKESKRFADAIDAGATWQETMSRISNDYAETAWSHEIVSLRPQIAKGVGSFLSRWFGGYRSASAELSTLLKGPLPESARERLILVDKLASAQSERASFLEEVGYLKKRLGELWRGERTDFLDLKSSQNWLKEAHGYHAGLSHDRVQEVMQLVASEPEIVDDLPSALAKAEKALRAPIERLTLHLEPQGEVAGTPLVPLRDRLQSIRSQMHRYREWARLASCRRELESEEMLALVDLLETEAVEPGKAVDEFLYATAEARWSKARSLLPELDRLAELDRHQLVDAFRKLDWSRIADVRRLIRSKHLEQLPRGAAGEMGIIRGEIAKKRRIRPIRKVMSLAGPMVQRIKTVFMMSPISVAQFLPPGQVKFDLLVIDEASQVRPEEALGAIARTKQIVVVGDQKQLPPTSFFDRLADDVHIEEDEEQGEDTALPATRAEEMESILTLCEARGLRPRMLEWHYRSRDPSLITVSNKEFYEDRLVLPPAPFQLDDRFGLKFTRVAGVYSSRSRGGGRAGTNRKEAEAVAKALGQHARNSPNLSVGVVSFSKAQADMMSEVLELERRKDEVLDDFMREGRTEDVFVKNIENVQGDERDIILISVGYGPHEPRGRLASMYFGPVNSDGGERRLNVLFTRARVRCEVFVSFDPGEIDLSRTTGSGPRILKRFLEYAKSGVLDERLVTGDDADSPFEEDVAEVIASMGFKVDLQVGSAGFKIDMAVRHPKRAGEYVLAVECDGATYHGAIWARERDRLRQEILEGFGWRFHRIWSTDWFHNRSFELNRLNSAINNAVSSAEDLNTLRGANHSDAESEHVDSQRWAVGELEVPELVVPTYRKANVFLENAIDPHEVPTAMLSEHTVTVVEVEGPIHTDEVARRIAAGFGKKRTGNRIQDATLKALMHAKRIGRIVQEGDFWLTERHRSDLPVRDRSEEVIPTTKPEYLSAMEVRAAADMILKESGHVETDELVRAISRLLGYKKAGKEFQARVKDVLKSEL